MTINFSVEVEAKDPPVVRVQGEIDIYTCQKLHQVLSDVIAEGHTSFTLDLENIQYIDSTGLGTIAQSANQVMNQSGEIHIICSKPSVKKIFEVSGLQDKNIKLISNENQSQSTHTGT